jgi:hypothetical protein
VVIAVVAVPLSSVVVPDLVHGDPAADLLAVAAVGAGGGGEVPVVGDERGDQLAAARARAQRGGARAGRRQARGGLAVLGVFVDLSDEPGSGSDSRPITRVGAAVGELVDQAVQAAEVVGPAGQRIAAAAAGGSSSRR